MTNTQWRALFFAYWLVAFVIALPMIHRGILSGFVVLAPRPDGNLYRPDEIELLEFAVTQVGLDLHALQVDELRRELGRLQSLTPSFGSA